MKKLHSFAIGCLSIFVAINANAQVTIGLGEAPVSGALLQLKSESNAVPGGANAQKGLGMPRMVLTSKYDLSDIISNPTNDTNAEHIGLMVYQIGSQTHPTRGNFCPGLYVWDGNEWQSLSSASNSKSRFDSGSEILYDSEGNSYSTAYFGPVAGRWMTQNLQTKMVGTCHKIGLSSDASSAEEEWAEPRYYYPGGKRIDESGAIVPPSTWTGQQGLLYNWAAATNMKGGETGKDALGDEGESGSRELTGKQGICPEGWHMPSDKEWNDLEQAIGENPGLYTQNGGAVDWDEIWRAIRHPRGDHSLGKYMKSTIALNGNPTQGDSSPSTGGASQPSSTQRGFDAILAGNAEAGVHNLFGFYGYFWTYSASNPDNKGKESAWVRQIKADPKASDDHHRVGRFPMPRHNLLSVRCKQD